MEVSIQESANRDSLSREYVSQFREYMDTKNDLVDWKDDVVHKSITSKIKEGTCHTPTSITSSHSTVTFTESQTSTGVSTTYIPTL